MPIRLPNYEWYSVDYQTVDHTIKVFVVFYGEPHFTYFVGYQMAGSLTITVNFLSKPHIRAAVFLLDPV